MNEKVHRITNAVKRTKNEWKNNLLKVINIWTSYMLSVKTMILTLKKKKKQVYVHNPINKVIKFQKKKNEHLTTSYV